MSTKKKIILIIAIVIILGTIICLFMFKNQNKNEDKYQNNKETDKIEELVLLIDSINEIYNSSEYSEKDYFINDNNLVCKKYIGTDVEEYIEKMKKAYINPFSNNGYFEIITKIENDIEQEQLYVCKNPTCEVTIINNNYEIIESDLQTIINFYGLDISIDKDLEYYRIDYPVVPCK